LSVERDQHSYHERPSAGESTPSTADGSPSTERDPPNDTSPEAERIQIELLRRMSIAQRVDLAMSLSRTVTQLAYDAIRGRMLDAGEDEVRVKFVTVHYGEALAERFREALARRRR
jgi:hypothetical protein